MDKETLELGKNALASFFVSKMKESGTDAEIDEVERVEKCVQLVGQGPNYARLQLKFDVLHLYKDITCDDLSKKVVYLLQENVPVNDYGINNGVAYILTCESERPLRK